MYKHISAHNVKKFLHFYMALVPSKLQLFANTIGFYNSLAMIIYFLFLLFISAHRNVSFAGRLIST